MPSLLSPRAVRLAHRWLGLGFSLIVFTSAGSGLLHTVMARTQAPPPPARPAGSVLDPTGITRPPSEALDGLTAEGAEILGVNLRSIGGEPWYQVFLKGESTPRYRHAETGRDDPSRDEAMAAEVAEAFLGGRSARRTAYLTEFDNEYVNIFRILPVYRFDAEDDLGTRVYVSTTTGSVTRHTDDGRQLEANIFGNLHKWNFVKDKDIRDGILVSLMAGLMLVSALGIVLFVGDRPPRRRASPPSPAG